MQLEVKVGPPQLAIHQGHTVLISEPDGSITGSNDKGLYFFDTRLISSWSIYANGETWDLLNSGAGSHDAACIFLVNRTFATEAGDVVARSIGLVMSRVVDGGMREELQATNFGQRAVRFNLEIAFRCDFADIFEVKAASIVRRGRITTQWASEARTLTTTYRNQDFLREVRVCAVSDGETLYANGRISFDIALPPGASWHGLMLYELSDAHHSYSAPARLHGPKGSPQEAHTLQAWRDGVMQVQSSNDGFERTYGEAVEDMAALRLPITGPAGVCVVPAAGLPWFVALFGRDTLITSLQTAMINTGFAAATLEVLARYQATEPCDYRDAEPGKIMHELRLGELAHFKLVPHTPYYGTADATPLFLITLHTAWRWSGDRGLLLRHLGTAKPVLSGSTATATAMATDSRNIRRGLRRACKIKAGRIRASLSCAKTGRS